MVLNSLAENDIISESGLQLPYKPAGKARIMVGGGRGSYISKYKNFLFVSLPRNEQLFLLLYPGCLKCLHPNSNRNQVTTSYVGLIFEDL